MSGPRIISRHHHVDVCLSCGAEHGGLRLVSHSGRETFRCPVSNGIVSDTEASIVVDAGVDVEPDIEPDVDDTPDPEPEVQSPAPEGDESHVGDEDEVPSDGTEAKEEATTSDAPDVTSFAAEVESDGTQ